MTVSRIAACRRRPYPSTSSLRCVARAPRATTRPAPAPASCARRSWGDLRRATGPTPPSRPARDRRPAPRRGTCRRAPERRLSALRRGGDDRSRSHSLLLQTFAKRGKTSIDEVLGTFGRPVEDARGVGHGVTLQIQRDREPAIAGHLRQAVLDAAPDLTRGGDAFRVVGRGRRGSRAGLVEVPAPAPADAPNLVDERAVGHPVEVW